MPDNTQIVDIYDEQITLKFYSKKHQYFRRLNTHPVVYKDFPQDTEIVASLEKTETEWVKIPSTTGITNACLDKPFLYNWLVDVTAKTFGQCIKQGLTIKDAESKAKGARWKAMKKGGNIGTNVHNWISQFIEHIMDDEQEAPDIDELNQDEKNCVYGFLDWYEKHVKDPIETEHLVYHPGLDIGGTLDFIFINQNDELEVVDFKTGYTINPGDVMQLAFYRKAYALQYQKFPDVASIVHLQKDEPKAIPYMNLNHDASMIAFECGHYLVNWRDTLKI